MDTLIRVSAFVRIIRKLAAMPLFLFVFLIVPARTTQAEGFELIISGSHYEPSVAVPFIALPGANMKAGEFKYLSDEGDLLYKAGILADGAILYYVDSDKNAASARMSPHGYSGVFDPSGDCNFGVYGNFYLMDCWCCASASGHGRRMYLFRYGKNNVELLDVIRGVYGSDYGVDFMSALAREKKYGFMGTDYNLPTWMDIRDMDGDGNPEVNVIVSWISPNFEPEFELYFEVKNDRLQVNINPELYKPLFDAEARKTGTPSKSSAYYIYGFVSGRLKYQDIKRLLEGDRRYKMITGFLEDITAWNAGLHDFHGEKPVLLKYEVKRRK